MQVINLRHGIFTAGKGCAGKAPFGETSGMPVHDVESMLRPKLQRPLEAVELLGDLHPLVAQLGSVDGLVTLAGAAASLDLRPVDCLSDFRVFLRDYHTRLLGTLELPSISQAYGFARRNELRELVALDRRLGDEPLLREFAAASRRVGAAQLQRLRPLHDDRFVQRYLAAVDQGDAQGWHTLVYGLTMAVYSLPLRQGLIGYADQTTRGFIWAASRSLRISEPVAAELLEEFSAGLPAVVESLVGPGVSL
jgi:urease accessory protein UreF